MTQPQQGGGAAMTWIDDNCPYSYDNVCPCPVCDPDKKSPCHTCHYADADLTCRIWDKRDSVYERGAP